MLLAFCAALAMLANDILATIMVQAEARNRWVIAGLMDCLGWIAAIATTSIAVGNILLHGLTSEACLIIAFVTIANFVGTAIGVQIGKRFVHSDSDAMTVLAPTSTSLTPSTAQPGDLVFCHSKGIVGWLIRLLTRSKWNHVAVLQTKLSNGDWTVIQAVGHGVIADTPQEPSLLSSIAPGGDYVLVPAPSTANRELIVSFMEEQIGVHYGFLTIASIVFTLISPRFVCFMTHNTWICSAVAAEACRYGGWYAEWPDIYQVKPSDLYFALTGTSIPKDK